MTRDARPNRDLHALDENGMVLCNPRDKEAAHRAEMEGIATCDVANVTCPKCITLLHQMQRERRSCTNTRTPDSQTQLSGDVEASTGEVIAGEHLSANSSSGGTTPSSSTSSHFRRRREIESIVAEIRPDDGVDPREEKRKRLRMNSPNKMDLASERLRSQIFDALRLSTLLADVGLEDFTFAGVTPTGRGGRFVVDVCHVDADAKYESRDIEDILQENKGLFRTEVSQFVNRRKAPELRFRVLPPGVQL